MTKERNVFQKNKWFFSLGAIGHDMIYSLVVSYLLTYIQFGFVLTVEQYLVISLAIGVLGRIWDALTDPLMGLLIQRCNFKSGKYKPWLMIGAFLAGMLTVMMFNAKVDGWTLVIYIIVLNYLWELAYTINDIAYWSLLPALSSDSKERSVLSTFTLFFAGVGGGLAQGLVTIFQTGNILSAYSFISILAAIMIMLTQGLTTIFVKENHRDKYEDSEKVSFKQMIKIIFSNKQLLYMSLSLCFYTIGNGIFISLLYNIYYIEMGYDANIVFALVGFALASSLIQFIYPKLSQRFARKKILSWATAISISGYLLFLLIGWTKIIPFNFVTLLISGMLIYCGNSFINLITVIQITNCVEYNEYITHKRNEPIVSTARPFAVKFSTAIKYALVSVGLIISGVYSLSQNVSTLEAQKAYFSRISDTESHTEFEVKSQYFELIKEYSENINNCTSTSYDYTLKQIDEEISKNKILTQFKLEAKDICIISSLYVIEDNKISLGPIKDLEVSKLDKNKDYSIEISGEYVDEKGEKVSFNVGNENFKNKAKFKEKFLLRIIATILPIICIFFAWFIQYRKYIIDEKYYDSMLIEIEKRKLNK